MTPARLPYLTLECRLAFEGDGTLSGFFENTLRGMFGLSLREIACVTRAPTCDGCTLAASCVYAQTLTPHAPDGTMLTGVGSAPPPYLFFCGRDDWNSSPWHARPGVETPVYLRLFGQSLVQLPYYVHAILRMQERGLGRDRVAFAVRGIVSVPGGEILYTPEDPDRMHLPSAFSGLEVDPDALLAEGAPRDAVITCISPLRLQKDGRILRRPTAEVFFHALLRRIAVLFECYGPSALSWDYRAIQHRLSGVVMEPIDVRASSSKRFSGRQKRIVELKAPLGRFVFRGLPPGGLKLLEYGQVVSVGKSTTFGFGRYHLELL